MNEEKQISNERKTLLSVAFDAAEAMYSVEVAQGSNVAETAFAMAIVIKCLIRDNVIENKDVVLDLINKYLSDPQYDEVKENE